MGFFNSEGDQTPAQAGGPLPLQWEYKGFALGTAGYPRPGRPGGPPVFDQNSFHLHPLREFSGFKLAIPRRCRALAPQFLCL